MSEDDLGIVIDDSPSIQERDEASVTQPSEPIAPATPAPEPAAQPPAETEEQKQTRIAKEAYEHRATKRELAALRKQLEEMQNAQNQKPKPVVPDLPDPLTLTPEQLQQSLVTRDEAIRQAALYEAEQQAIARQSQMAEDARQRAEQEAIATAGQQYSAKAVQLGLKPEELYQAGMMVAQSELNPEVAKLILSDEHGPLITKYLASNPSELDRFSDLSKANPYQAAIELVTLLKPKAAALKPKVSSAPAPGERIGSGLMTHDDYGPAGATYE